MMLDTPMPTLGLTYHFLSGQSNALDQLGLACAVLGDDSIIPGSLFRVHKLAMMRRVVFMVNKLVHFRFNFVTA